MPFPPRAAFFRTARRASRALILGVLLVPASTAAQGTFEEQVVALVNQERWNNGQLPPLKGETHLQASAAGHSEAMAVRDFFAHCDLDQKTSPWDRMQAAGYTGWTAAAENIAAGYADPQTVMTGWMQSSGHRANILSTSVREIGVGYFMQSSDRNTVRMDGGNCQAGGSPVGPFQRYWTQNFGTRSSVYPVVIAREAVQTFSRQVELYVYGAGWAVDMHFRNEAGAWSAWEPYWSTKTWAMSPGNGTKTVQVELRKGTSILSATDTILLQGDATAVPGDLAAGDGRLHLEPAYPNPFRSRTQFAYELTEEGPVHIAVFDVQGRRVAALLTAMRPAGRYEAAWEGDDDAGRPVGPGLYFVRVRTRGAEVTQRVVRYAPR